MSEYELIIKKLEIVRDTEENGCYICDKEHSKILLDGINKQKEVLDKIKKYIEENKLPEIYYDIENLKPILKHYIDADKILELLEEIE